MRHHRTVMGLAMLVGVALLVTVSVQAQSQQPSPQQAAPRSAAPEPSKELHVEGTVSKVDAMERTVGVSTGLFGLLGRTVQVDEGTQIRVQGQPATLGDVREGDRIRASYEVRDRKNIAKLIDVTAEKVELAPPSGGSSTPKSPPTQ